MNDIVPDAVAPDKGFPQSGENDGAGAHAAAPSLPTVRIDPAEFPLTQQDRHELHVKRGLTDETIAAARLGSVKNQADLDHLGIDAQFDELRSTVIIPYGVPDSNGAHLFRLHKLSLKGTVYPPYIVLPRRDTLHVILCESEFKALAAHQLGHNSIGLQGIHSHINRFDELAQAVRELGCDNVIVCLDTIKELQSDDEQPNCAT